VVRDRDRLRAEGEQRRLERERLAANCPQWVAPGHFYSPIPRLDAIRAREGTIFDRTRRALPGIELHESEQLALLRTFEPYYAELPFQAQRTPGLRYFFENPTYSYSDAIFLYCMIRHARPSRIIEVGSGYSSCVTLDTSERFFDSRIACTFIEPYPDGLLSLIRPADRDRIELVASDLQAVGLERFRALAAGDILFVDSTHVSRVGSDVNYLFFEILPQLAPGVLVHFHDVFYPFEYPEPWVYEGRAWTEAYLLRAFLAFNDAFEIVLFNTYLETFHQEYFARAMPLCLKNPGGSIWLRKRR
jgi:predicted O-methyltransferase YrrM